MPIPKTYFEQVPLKAIAKIVEEQTQEQPAAPVKKTITEKEDDEQSRRERVRSV